MVVYVSLFNWTEQGIKNVKETTNRVKDVRKSMESVGARVIGIWWTVGQYDGVLVFEAPDDETANAQLMNIGMQGNVRTTTMRAFGEEEMARVIQKVR